MRRAFQTVCSATRLLGFLLLCAAALSSCRSVSRYAERSAPIGAREGVASYYADDFHGRRTASGETYDKRKLTAASVDLPFGTRVRVTNLQNGRSVVVRINDRMPKNDKGRIIDLSLAGARALDMLRSGVARVRVETLDD
ncbi:MAG: septal ring lytic transglycosylase RlpA family protein [Chloroherpetonaceae bacterium]|nr:septal ring lytic transglycosylase RlpA family protein [Chloroherpetonaceae bacterium]MDW8437006.1 septal ring lytic transglycosylase RlpA family protein [Chloroherpetonaceae bacterium]